MTLTFSLRNLVSRYNHCYVNVWCGGAGSGGHGVRIGCGGDGDDSGDVSVCDTYMTIAHIRRNIEDDTQGRTKGRGSFY